MIERAPKVREIVGEVRLTQQHYGVPLLESIPEGNLEGTESPFARKFRHGKWRPVASRAYMLMARMSLMRERSGGTPYRPEAMEKSAALIGEYHVWRHTPRIDRDDDWPKSKKKFAEGYGVTVAQLDHVLSLCHYSKWEKRFLDYTDPVVRAAIVKDVILAGAARQIEAEPGKENANLLRTAMQVEGELKGTQRITQVNVGSNVLNMPEGFTEENLQARIERFNRLAAQFAPKEVPHREVPDEPEDAGDRLPPPAGA